MTRRTPRRAKSRTTGGPRSLRPTAARVRVALFDRLGAVVHDGIVLDLFAGTGALGIEALQRGARRAVFVEVDAVRCRALRDALRRAGLQDRADVCCEDARAALDRFARRRAAFTLILLDPPYGEGWLDESLSRIEAGRLLAPGGWIVAEGHWRDQPASDPRWTVVRDARYGETALWFIQAHVTQTREGGAGVRIAVYPGSFDPVHHGHLEVIRRAVRLFDRVIVAVAKNVDKFPGAFSLDERVEMLREVVRDLPSVEVAAFGGLTVEFARERGATCLVKGLRAVGDFDYELKQSAMNRRLAPSLDTLLFIADPEFAFVSSSLIREVARLGGDVDGLVPQLVAERLRAQWPREG